MAQVEFINVIKRFEHEMQLGKDRGDSPNHAAVQSLNLTINDGELLVLVGPSGCGKSTTLRLLAGLEEISAGEIKIDGLCVNQRTPQQRNIAMVFQNYALYPHMSVHANLEFPLKMAKVPQSERQQKIAEIVDILNLSELLARKPKQLSGGQRQRVAMGRALVRDPSVFLLDEPLSNLDAKLRAQIRADIAQLQKRLNKTTLYVTHDQVEAMTLGDRVAVMNAGELQQIGTPEQLYTRPANVFVSRFIGNPGMNIVPAHLLSKDNLLFMKVAGQHIELPNLSLIKDSLIDYIEQPLLLGFRPEAVQLAASEDSISLSVEVLAQEFLGHETLIHFNLGPIDESGEMEKLIARVPGRIAHLSRQNHTFYLDPAKLYWFEVNGQRLYPTRQQIL